MFLRPLLITDNILYMCLPLFSGNFPGETTYDQILLAIPRLPKGFFP